MANSNAKYYPSISNPTLEQHDLLDTVQAAKQNIEILTRKRKPVIASAVTWQDLIDLGLITADQVPSI